MDKKTLLRSTITVALLFAAALSFACSRPRASGPLPHEAYVWQRSWDGGPQSALDDSASLIAGAVVLAAEVSWDVGKARTVYVAVDWAAIKSARVPAGIALRAGPYSGDMGAESELARAFADMAKKTLADARNAGVPVREVQVDFDCAESKLAGFRESLAPLREAIAPVPLIITALPSWMRHREFKKLARAVDGYVLQVHSLEMPADVNSPFTLCDPAKARHWIEQAGRLGLPFRVALPTYGYVTAFDASGRFIGLSAEGPERMWPPGTKLSEVRTDPDDMAALVRDLTASRPACLTGTIWYRLPVPGDRLNWPMETLRAVMAGRPPRSALTAEVRTAEPGLADIFIVNAGERAEPMDLRVQVKWPVGMLLAGDGLAGFRLEASPAAAVFAGTSYPDSPRLLPGETRQVGWLRWESETRAEAQVGPDEN